MNGFDPFKPNEKILAIPSTKKHNSHTKPSVQKNRRFFSRFETTRRGADGGEMADLSFGIFSEDFATGRLELPVTKRKYEMFFPYGTHGNGRKFMIVEIPLFTGFYTFQVVQKFFQQ